MRIICLFSVFLFVLSCSKSRDGHAVLVNQKDSTERNTNVEKIIVDKPILNPLKTKKITLLITNSVNTFFLYKGESMGLEYELLRLFLKDNKIELEIKLIDDTESIRDSLHTMGAHIAAGTFIIPDNPLPSVIYSNPIYNTDLLLVKHKDQTASVAAPLVIKDAPYIKYLWDGKNKPEGVFPEYISGKTTQELLLKQVHTREIEATIANAREFEIVQAMYSDLVIEKILAKNAPVGFMFHLKMDTLRDAFNLWLKKNKRLTDYRWIVQKYDALPGNISKLVKAAPIEKYTSTISHYDILIQKHSKNIGWDWRLVASLIHQESHFNPQRRSWAGACGLMQVMPKTASAYGHIYGGNIFIPQSNILAGTKYIQWLENNFFKDSSITAIDKHKFIIASYNAGPNHIEDARALCVKYKLDANVWDDNVEKMVLAKMDPVYYEDPVCKYGYCRGYETIIYVKNIMKYYDRYASYYKE